MKKKILAFLAMSAAIAVMLAACGKNSGNNGNVEDDDRDPPTYTEVEPKIADGAIRNFALDLYGEYSHELSVSDYIDENGAQGVSYTAVSSDGDVLSVSAFTNGTFTVTALAVGNGTVTLNALMNGQIKLGTDVNFTVTDSAPQTPVIEKDVYAYDKNAGGIFELPISLNGSDIAFLRKDGVRLDSGSWTYAADTGCVILREDICLELALGGYKMEVVTTGGTVEFKLDIFNTVKTSFDDVREKSVELGKADSVHFDVDFNGATVKKLTFGGYEISESDYSVTASGIDINASFFARTYVGDDNSYRITLSNNDTYDFDIKVANRLFFTDYDATAVHNDTVSNAGQNPLYQDSTRVEITDAPDDSGMSGKVLKFTPHTEDVPLDVHGIYTFADNGSTSTWHKINFKNGMKYLVSFDYMTDGTTEGEDIAFRSWIANSMVYKRLETGKSGQIQRFEYIFEYDVNTVNGVYVFGKLLNGGCIYFDNFAVTELDSLPEIIADNYDGGDEYHITAEMHGYLIDDVLIDGKSVSFAADDNSIVLDVDEIKALDFGTHEISVVNPLFKSTAEFNCVNTVETATLTEKSKVIDGSETSVKLNGEFDDGISIVSVTRSGALDWDVGQSISLSGFTVVSDGLVIGKSVIDGVYKACKYDIEFSNGGKETISLTNDKTVFRCDFDDVDTWTDKFADDGVSSELVYDDDFGGKVLKVDPSENNAYSGWFNGIFRMHNGYYDDPTTAYPILDFDGDKYYEFTFDYKVEMNGAAHTNLGYYFIDKWTSGEREKLGAYEDGNIHAFSVVMRGDRFTEFAIRLDPRESDGLSRLFIDNFRIVETDTLFACDFDGRNTWSDKLTEDYGVVSIENGIDGFTGNVLKLQTGNWKVHDPSTWFTRVFCLTVNGHDAAWVSLDLAEDEYYEFSFDYKVDMNGVSAHANIGYYYNFVLNGGHEMSLDGKSYTDGAVHTFTATVKGSDLTEFCIGLDPRDNDLQSVMYIDNFAVRRVKIQA